MFLFHSISDFQPILILFRYEKTLKQIERLQQQLQDSLLRQLMISRMPVQMFLQEF